MARARNIKPAFFTNELLGVADPMISLTFAGLWCLADKIGVLEDRPLRIKAELFPYRDSLDVNGYLTELARLGFIVRYENAGRKLIQVTNFRRHQSPHHTEKAKGYPLPNDPKSLILAGNGYATVKEPCVDGGSQVPERSDSLIPDSGFTDSLIPDSKDIPPAGPAPVVGELLPAAPAKPATAPKTKPTKDPAVETEYQAAARATWAAYAEAYTKRHGAAPLRDAKVNSNIKAFIARVGYEDAPHIAAFFLTVNEQFVVKRMHDFGDLLSQAQAYRTQWVTGRRMTHELARQADNTSTNAQTAEAAKAIMRARSAQNAQ